MKYRFIENHVANAALPIDNPWSHVNQYPTLLVEKSGWRQWCRDPDTRHCFVSCLEGVAPDIRIGQDNPVFSASGLIVDFDSLLDLSDLKKLAKRHGEYAPAWVSRTFSDNARFGWDFERPILIAGAHHWSAFAGIAIKALALNKHHAGFEREALTDPAKYYDVGREHVALTDEKIPFATLVQWSIEATRKIQMAPQEYKVPLEAIQAEVERRWPGRWRGPFTDGARGVRFWDPSANNDTAAVVREEGMLCYTGGQAFVTWREIFGVAFCRQFEAQQLAPIIDSTWYDGQRFWGKDTVSGFWQAIEKGDFTQRLRVSGYDQSKARGKTASKVDEIEGKIKTEKRVDAAAPFIHRPEGVILYNNMRFLNTARAKCMEPMPEAMGIPNPGFDDLKQNCGRLIYPFLRHFLGGENDQLWHLLAWVKHKYVNGYRRTPKRSQMTFLCGQQSTGKTFFIQAILTPILGGCGKGGSFLTGQNKWSAELAQCPLIAMDDDEGSSGDHRDMVRYTQRIKSIVANGELMFAQKFGSECAIEWLGALIAACNRDSHSLARSLPDLDLSVRNKIHLFLTNEVPFPGFSTLEENREILIKELPWFCRWLLDWNPPECTAERNEKRFGMNAYHHPDLLRDVSSQGYDEISWGVITAMMEMRAENFKTLASKADPWLYRASLVQMHADLVSTNAIYMRDLKVQVLQRCLQSLAKKGRPVSREIDSMGREVWAIDLRAHRIAEKKASEAVE